MYYAFNNRWRADGFVAIERKQRENRCEEYGGENGKGTHNIHIKVGVDKREGRKIRSHES